MPYPDATDVVQRFTGTLDTSTTAPLASALKIAIDDYSGHLSGATNLGEALTLIDVLAASGTNIFLGFSDDGMTWHDDPVAGDLYIRFASGQTRPIDTSPDWSVGIRFVGQGVQGAFYIRQYQNSVAMPAVPTGGSYDGATGILTPSTGWTVDVTVPGAGENTWYVQWLVDPAIHTGTVTPTWSAIIEAGGTGPPGSPGVTLTELFAALLPGSGIAFDDTTPGQRTISADPTIARLDSPVLTGIPTAPTLGLGASTLGLVNAEWLQREIGGLVDTVAVAGDTLTVTDRDGVARNYALPAGGGGMAGGSGDLQVQELLNRLTSLALPANHLWVDAGLSLADSIQVLLIDASDATDDYEVVDWDGIKVLPAGVAGQTAAAGSFHTFQATIQDVVYEVRIGHTATNEVLLAANQVGALDLPELRVDRLLAPIELITGINVDTAFRGDGAVATPLMLNVAGADFPIIPTNKGGTGASSVGLARTNLGLGTAAVLNAGTAAGDVPVLETGGVLLPSALAPGGVFPQVLTRTTAGQEWASVPVPVDGYVDTATLSLNASDELVLTLGRNAGLGTLVTTPLVLPAGGLATIATNTAFGGDGSASDPLTMAVAGTDFPVITLVKGGTGATDAAGARTALGLGTAAVADTGTAVGNLALLGANGVFSPDLLASGGSLGRRLTYGLGGLAEWAVDTGQNRVWQATSVSYVPNTFTIAVTGVVIESGMLVVFQAPAGTYSGINVVQVDVNSTGVQDLVDRNGNQIPAEAIVAGRLYVAISTSTDYRLVAEHLTETSVSGVTVAMTTRELTVTVRDNLGGMFADTQTFNLSAGSIASGTFGSGRVGTGPLAGEFLSTDGSVSAWRNIVPSDLHGGAVGQFVRSDGAMGDWTNFVPADFAAGAANGELLGVTAGALAWLAPSGVIGVESIIPGEGMDVDQRTGDVTISIESQYLGRNLGTAALPTFSLSGGNYLITLGISDVPAALYQVGDTFTFYVPDPINQAGNDTSPLLFLPGTTGNHFDIVDPIGGAQLTRADLTAGALHTVRHNQLGRFALVEPGPAVVPDTNDYVQTATFATVGRDITLLMGRTGGLADVVSNTFTLPADTNQYVDTAALTLNTSDEILLTLGRTGALADIVTVPLALPSGLTDTNEYVDTATLALSGNDLTLTLGRTGSLSDVASNVLALPSGGGVNVSAWNATDTFGLGHIVTRNGRAYIARLQNTNADPDLPGSAASWFLIRTGEEIIHTAGRFYAPGTVVNATGGSRDVYIARRPTTDTPGPQDADWFHLPRGAVIVEAVTAAGTYRSGTMVTIGSDAYYCHTSVVLPGITSAQIPAHANFTRMTAPTGLAQVFRDTAFTGVGTAADPLEMNVGGADFPVIPLDKGGTGATDALGARTNFGLGSAALVDTGVALGEIPLLGTDGLLDAGRFAPAGVIGQALLRTATGQEWGDVAGATGGLRFMQLGFYQFPGDIAAAQDNQLFDTGIAAPANSTQIYHLVMGDDNGRIGTAMLHGSEIAGLTPSAAPVWVNDISVGIGESGANSRSFGIGPNRALFLGITNGGNLAIGTSREGVRPYVSLSEVVGGGSGGGTGTQHYYPIPDTGVGGTGDATTLTTGETIAGYTNGLQVYYNSNDANTGAVTLAVDGLPPRPLRGSNGRGSATDLPARAITAEDPVLAVYDSEFDEFYFIPGHHGTAAQRNVGLFEFDLPALGTDGILASSTLATGGVVGQALLLTATGQEWGDVAAGGLAGITGETEFLFAGVWADLQVRATNIQVPADARYIAAVMQMAGAHSSSSDDPYTSVQVFDADRFRAFSAIAEGANPRDNNGNFFGVDFGGAPNDLLVAKVTSGGNEVIGIAATTQTQARVRSIRVRFITDLAGAGVNDYVEVASLALSGQDLTLTLGRTGSLVDVVSAALALPFGVGTITGVMTGAGIIGGGTAGTVTVGIDPSQAGFPVIPLDKGGTGATDAAGARTALGLGSAALRDVGDAQFNVAVLQADGAFTVGKFAPGGTDGQVLTRTATGKEWADGGDITAVLTAAGSGLTGGTTAGSANLALDIVGLPALSSTQLTDADEFVVGDVSDAANPRKRISFGSMMAFAADDASIESSGGRLGVKDRGIRESMLDTNNVATAGMVLSFDGVNDFTWVDLPSTRDVHVDAATLALAGDQLRLTLGRTSGMADVVSNLLTLPVAGVYTDADVDARLIDRLQNATHSGVSFNDRLLMWDDGNPGQLRSTTFGTARGYLVAGWAQPTSSDTLPDDKVADGSIVEAKLSITGTPTTGQFIAWDGSGMEWASVGGIVNNFVDAATLALSGNDLTLTLGRDGLGDVVSNVLTLPAGGTGDITSVGAGNGLSGGGVAGDVTLVLDLDGLPLVAGIEAVDNIAFADTSDGGNVRRVTWGGAIARAADQDTLATSSGVMRIATNGVDTNELAPEAVTEPNMDISNTPVDGQRLGFQGGLVWVDDSGPPPVLTHTRYAVFGADSTFVEADYTGGVSFTSDTFTTPTITTPSFLAIAVPASNPITAITLLGAFNQNITTQFTQGTDLDIAGESHNVWVSNQALPTNMSNQMLRLS